MAHQVQWNKIIVDRFVELAMLSEEEEAIIRTRVSGWTITKQAMELGMSESKVSRIISKLKAKYDDVQRYDPLLPKRKVSKEEIYMDTH